MTDRDPTFDVELLDGTLRQYDPWQLTEQFDRLRVDGPSFYETTRRIFDLPSLSRYQCLFLVSETYRYIDDLASANKDLVVFADLLRFFPGLGIDRLEKMDPRELLLWKYHMRRLKAEEKLELQSTLGALMAEPQARQMHQVALAETAFALDEKQHGIWLEAISRCWF